MSASSPLVSAEWLKDHLTAPDLRVVDGSWSLDKDVNEHRRLFADEHIPGAVFFDLVANSDKTSDIPHMLPSSVAFTSAARKLGLGDGSTIVVYDQLGMFSAARIWWMFRAMGHEHVMVLDGGLPAWKAAGGPLSDRSDPFRERHFTARRQAALIKDKRDVARAMGDDSAQIVDARSPTRFAGAANEPRPGVRAGHVPGASNVHYRALLDDDGRFKPKEALRAAFLDAGVSLDRPIITTCGSGVTAAIIGLALTLLGHERWGLYDGSWAEWGSDPDMPVEIGDPRG